MRVATCSVPGAWGLFFTSCLLAGSRDWSPRTIIHHPIPAFTGPQRHRKSRPRMGGSFPSSGREVDRLIRCAACGLPRSASWYLRHVGARHRRYDGSPDHKEHPQPAPQVKVPSYQREGGGSIVSDRRRSGSLGRRSTATSSDLSPARGCAGGAPGSRSVWEGVGRRRAPRAARGAAALRWSPPSVPLRDRIVAGSRKRPSNSIRRARRLPTPLKLAVHYCLCCGSNHCARCTAVAQSSKEVNATRALRFCAALQQAQPCS